METDFYQNKPTLKHIRSSVSVVICYPHSRVKASDLFLLWMESPDVSIADNVPLDLRSQSQAVKGQA